MLPILSLKYFMLFKPHEHSIVFLSYDEPNCETNYQHLLTLAPNALRVHGVKGSDAAHKECARIAQSKNVIIVDGDNFVKPVFFNAIELPDDIDLDTSVLSFSGLNSINGTSYGNGGIKVWPVSVINSMKTHEASENGKFKIDFEFQTYIELNIIASDVMIHTTPLQAFRAGFREGVKLCLEDEKPITFDKMDKFNFDRLWLWMHVGSDIENGLYSIYGARLGAYSVLNNKLDYTRISDFDYLNFLFTTVDLNDINSLGRKLKHHMIVDAAGPDDSLHIRTTFINPKRSNIPTFSPSRFYEWADSFRECAKTTDLNKVNMLCTMGREKPFGVDRINGARAAKGYNDNPINLYDFMWLKEKYDRLHTNSI